MNCSGKFYRKKKKNKEELGQGSKQLLWQLEFQLCGTDIILSYNQTHKVKLYQQSYYDKLQIILLYVNYI